MVTRHYLFTLPESKIKEIKKDKKKQTKKLN